MAISVRLSHLTFDPTLYPRKKVNRALSERYAEQMEAGAHFPPMDIATVNAKPGIILDGVHRYNAYKSIKRGMVEVEDHGRMDFKDAFALAVKLNARHGQALTMVEKLDAYKKLLSEGYAIEKASEILSVPPDQVKRWAGGTTTNALTGKPVNKIDRKVILWRVRELKSIIKNGLNGDEEVHKQLNELRGKITELETANLQVILDLKQIKTVLGKIKPTQQAGRDLETLKELIDDTIGITVEP